MAFVLPAAFTATVAGGIGLFQWMKHRKAVEQELISESSDVLHKRLSVQLYDFYHYLIEMKMSEKKFDNEYGTRLFKEARYYMVTNKDNIPPAVMAEIRAAGGLQDYLESYINRRIAAYYLKIDEECQTRSKWLAALADENIIVNIEALRNGDDYTKLNSNRRLNYPLHRVFQNPDDFDAFIGRYASDLGGDFQGFIDNVSRVLEEEMLGKLQEQMLDLLHNGLKTAPELHSHEEESDSELESHPLTDVDLMMLPGLENLVEPTELFNAGSFNQPSIYQLQQLNTQPMLFLL